MFLKVKSLQITENLKVILLFPGQRHRMFPPFTSTRNKPNDFLLEANCKLQQQQQQQYQQRGFVLHRLFFHFQHQAVQSWNTFRSWGVFATRSALPLSNTKASAPLPAVLEQRSN